MQKKAFDRFWKDGMGTSKENEIDQLIKHAKAVDEDVKSTFCGFSARKLNWKPSEKVWSVAQCLEHLVVTNDLYFENIQKVADGTHRNNFFSRIPLTTDIIGFVMKKVLSPDRKPKMKTIGMFKPSSSEISEDILEKFGKNQSRLIALMEASKAFDCNMIKVAEPIGSFVNLRLFDAFEVLVIHEQRHLIQAKGVFGLEDFPH